MAIRDIFIGKPLHWALLVAIAAVLWVVGEFHLHVTYFNSFVFIVLGLSLVALVVVVFGYREGDRIMREPVRIRRAHAETAAREEVTPQP